MRFGAGCFVGVVGGILLLVEHVPVRWLCLAVTFDSELACCLVAEDVRVPIEVLGPACYQGFQLGRLQLPLGHSFVLLVAPFGSGVA